MNSPRIAKILSILERAYGAPPARRRSPPVDELIRTILSQNTSDRNSLAAFAVLKRSFDTWEELLDVNSAKLAGLIEHAGLANIKATRIKEALLEIKRREGILSLGSLKKMGAPEAITYLRSLKGVGPKTAACVLLFSFGKPVMPVDTHIYRVTRRLGLIPKDLSIEEAHESLTEMFCGGLTLRRGRNFCQRPCSTSTSSVFALSLPKGSGSRPGPEITALIYSFHLGIIEHGRRTCKARNPECGVCLLYGLCKSGHRSAEAFRRAPVNAKADRRRVKS